MGYKWVTKVTKQSYKGSTRYDLLVSRSMLYICITFETQQKAQHRPLYWYHTYMMQQVASFL